MYIHPFGKNLSKITGAAISIALTLIMWLVLAMYINVPVTIALVDSICYIGLLSLAGYFSWYIIGFLKILQAQIVIAIVVQFLSLGVTFMLLSVFELENIDTFIFTIPLHLVIGLLPWMVLLQWYVIQIRKIEEKEESMIGAKLQENNKVENTIITKEVIAPVNHEVLDRISVKDGSRINIIKVEEVLYVQAYGDYVILYTNDGKYIKELTMKYLEANLPAFFIRCHRSYIVNSNYIVRLELFGKETYRLRLKNNVYLKVSSTGYKLLKDKLQL